jgi:hypothetical protein
MQVFIQGAIAGPTAAKIMTMTVPQLLIALHEHLHVDSARTD